MLVCSTKLLKPSVIYQESTAHLQNLRVGFVFCNLIKIKFYGNTIQLPRQISEWHVLRFKTFFNLLATLSIFAWFPFKNKSKKAARFLWVEKQKQIDVPHKKPSTKNLVHSYAIRFVSWEIHTVKQPYIAESKYISYVVFWLTPITKY